MDNKTVVTSNNLLLEKLIPISVGKNIGTIDFCKTVFCNSPLQIFHRNKEGKVIDYVQKLEEPPKTFKKYDADIDKFFSIISHNLKSPFQGIMGLSDLLNENMEELSIDERIEINKLLNTSIKKVYSLIEQLLEWLQIQTGRTEYNPDRVNLKTILFNVISTISISAQKKKITLSDLVEENLFVFAEANMIETVLRNLVSNAIKFTSEGGEIKIIAEQIDDYAVIKVIDSGIGMTEEVQRKLFKIEEHHTSLGTEGESGTGLGLILCKDLVKKNNGKIWVESELRVGSTFSFTLPVIGH